MQHAQPPQCYMHSLAYHPPQLQYCLQGFAGLHMEGETNSPHFRALFHHSCHLQKVVLPHFCGPPTIPTMSFHSYKHLLLW
uniref:Uncharacterized protein n=1 Tax=Rhizophora mucronata TaxID=61149 RepID=A0A2P2N068_RHIMU